MCAIDLFSKYVWVVALKDKKGISIINGFQKITSEGRRPNKIWVDEGEEFYNNLFKMILKKNNTEMYSTHSKWKSVVAERFIRTLRNKIFKHVTAISKILLINTITQFIKALKLKQLTLHLILMLNKMKIVMKKILNSKLVIMLGFQNTKTFRYEYFCSCW